MNLDKYGDAELTDEHQAAIQKMADHLIANYTVSGRGHVTEQQLRDKAKELFGWFNFDQWAVDGNSTDHEMNIEQACRVYEATIGKYK